MNTEEAWLLVKRQAQAWEQADLTAIIADFAPRGVFMSPGGRWQGPDAIRSAAVTFFETAHQVTIDIIRVIINGNTGAVEWHWSETRLATGTCHAADDAIVFVVGEDGKIVYWREYFDTAQMERQPLESSKT